jgi:hypothetical protein
MMNMGRVSQEGEIGKALVPILSWREYGAYDTILGMKSSGVQACVKYFINK